MPRINESAASIPFYLTKKVSEMAAREPGVVNLSRGQAGFLPPPAVYEEARRIIARQDKALFRYEHSAGAVPLREAIVRWYARRFDLEVDPRYVAVTVGGTGAITLALQTFSSHGDRIVIPDPSYPFYMLSARHGLDGRRVVRINIGIGRLDAGRLGELAAHDRLQLVMLTSPHNPNGAVYDDRTLREIVGVAKDSDFFVVCDENHFPEVYDGRTHMPIHRCDEGQTHSVMLGSLSRLALQGERIGWAVLPRVGDEVVAAYVAQTPFASTRAQRLAAFVLDRYEELGFDQVFKDYEAKRNQLVPEINRAGFECGVPEGTSYAFANIERFVREHRDRLEQIVVDTCRARGTPEEDVRLALAHDSILVSTFLLHTVKLGVVPGIAYGPDSDRYIRFTFSVEQDDIDQAILRLRAIPSALGGAKHASHEGALHTHQS